MQETEKQKYLKIVKKKITWMTTLVDNIVEISGFLIRTMFNETKI